MHHVQKETIRFSSIPVLPEDEDEEDHAPVSVKADSILYLAGVPSRPRLQLHYDHNGRVCADNSAWGLTYSVVFDAVCGNDAAEFLVESPFIRVVLTSSASTKHIGRRACHKTLVDLANGLVLEDADGEQSAPSDFRGITSISFECTFTIPGVIWSSALPYTDVLITQEEETRTFRADAKVLAAASEVLASTSLDPSNPRPFKLTWNSISGDSIEYLLKAIYVGYWDWRDLAKLDLDRVCALFSFIHPLVMKSIEELLIEFILDIKVDEKTVVQLQGLASLYEIEPLRKRVLRHLSEDKALFGKFALVERKRGRDGYAAAAATTAEEPKAKEAKS